MSSSSSEARLLLAIQASKQDTSLSLRQLATLYNVSRTSLQRRLNGIASRRDCKPATTKLTRSEKLAIVWHVLDLDTRGFPPTKHIIREMANKLLAERNRDPVGKHWPDNFIKRVPKLKTRWTRSYDRQRALNKDIRSINGWFNLICSTKEKWGIPNQDVYNFDETGFMMGVISSQLVVTREDRRRKPKLVQPGNREWTTVVQGINAACWTIPPYIIFVGKNHISTWYKDRSIPRDWVIGVSENGWTTNTHEVA